MSVVDSVLADSGGKDIGLVRAVHRQVVEAVASHAILGGRLVMEMMVMLGLDMVMVLLMVMVFVAPMSPVASHTVVEQIHSVRHGPSGVQAGFMDNSACIAETEVGLTDLVSKLSVKSSLFAVLLNSIHNILNHI